MATKNEIITLPNKHLRERSVKVGIVNEAIKKIIKNMQDATIDWENSRKHELGVALAAVQMDKMLRIVIIREDFEDKKNKEFKRRKWETHKRYDVCAYMCVYVQTFITKFGN